MEGCLGMELNRAQLVIAFVILAIFAPYLQYKAPLSAFAVPALIVMFVKYLLSFWLAEINTGGDLAATLTPAKQKTIRVADRVCAAIMFGSPALFAGLMIIIANSEPIAFVQWHEKNDWLWSLMFSLSPAIASFQADLDTTYGGHYALVAVHVIGVVGWTTMGAVLGVLIGRAIDWRFLSYAGPMVRLGPAMLLCYFIGAVMLVYIMYLKLYVDPTFVGMLDYMNSDSRQEGSVFVAGLIIYAGLFTMMPIFTIGAISIGDGLILMIRNIIQRSQAGSEA